MSNTEQFVVVRIGDDLYRNNAHNIVGNRRVLEEYAKNHHYGGGIVVYKQLAHGFEYTPIKEEAS